MIKPSQVKYTPPEDDYWSEHTQLFTTQFPTYYTKPQKVWGRFHISEEKFTASKHEIIPITEQAGKRTYVMMQPYVLESILTITVGLFDKPKHYADQDSPVGKTIGQPRQEGFREAQAGNAQAWYYHSDRTIVLWECFFDRRFRKHPFDKDVNMQKLWKGFEHWLIQKFPQATTLATPFNGPIAESIYDLYKTFLIMKRIYFDLENPAFITWLKTHPKGSCNVLLGSDTPNDSLDVIFTKVASEGVDLARWVAEKIQAGEMELTDRPVFKPWFSLYNLRSLRTRFTPQGRPPTCQRIVNPDISRHRLTVPLRKPDDLFRYRHYPLGCSQRESDRMSDRRESGSGVSPWCPAPAPVRHPVRVLQAPGLGPP